MFEVVVPGAEYFDESTFEFKYTIGGKFQIEHSLLSIAKWESKWEKPFFGKGRYDKTKMTDVEFLDYVRMMTITRNVDSDLYFKLTRQNYTDILNYMAKPMSATTIRRTNTPGDGSIVTAEILYFDMIQLGIPFECQKWHINRLMKLIEVCASKNSKPEKVPYAEMVAQRRALNAQRLSQFKTRG